jgi:hypothetical protein
MINSHSQAGQDLFVIEKTKNLKNGLFVDIAAGDPVFINNTFLLETSYGWDGISIELDGRWNEQWKKRKSLFLNNDAFSIDYTSLFENFLAKHKINNKHFNYLSLDLEPPELTNQLLHILPLNEYTFDIITYEHDLYRVGDKFKNDAKDYLYSLGYIIEKENIQCENNIFEDWYIKQ